VRLEIVKVGGTLHEHGSASAFLRAFERKQPIAARGRLPGRVEKQASAAKRILEARGLFNQKAPLSADLSRKQGMPFRASGSLSGWSHFNPLVHDPLVF